MIYNTNDDIRQLLKVAAGEENVTFAELARRCGTLPQCFNDIFRKKHISLDDVRKYANAMGRDVYIALVPKKDEETE